MEVTIDAKENGDTRKRRQEFGWFDFRPKWLRYFSSARFLLLLMCAYFVANSTVINGLYSTSVSTIEKRFSLSSSRMGMITSVYDVAALIFTGPVSYFGVRKKPVTLGLGMITMGIGYIVFTLPHFIAEEYIPVAGQSLKPTNYSNPLVCASSNSRAPSAVCGAREGSNLYYGLFLLAMFIAGAGCTPMISVGIPFMDENVSRVNAPLYIGIFQSSGVIAVVLGFLLSSVFLGIFVHPNASVTITQSSTSWIGAWWLGIAIGAGFAFIIGILLTGFPQKISKKEENQIHDKDATEGIEFVKQRSPTFKELPSVLKTLVLESPTFVLVSIAVSLQSFLISGTVAFSAKIALFQFRLTTSEVSVYMGLAAGTGALLGNLAGSFLLKKFKLSTVGILKLAVAIVALSTLLNLNSFIYCDTDPVPGINTHFPNSPSTAASFALNQECNKGCSCAGNMFVPTCINRMMYVNPCYAGCRTVGADLVFSNCSCIPNVINSQAKIGQCKSSCGFLAYLYFIIAFFVGFATSFNGTPCTIATLRCVPFDLRSFAMGLQWMLVRVLGAIPGPIIFGYVIDQSCIFWSKTCKSEGTCTTYNNKNLAMRIGSLTLGINLLLLIFTFLAYIVEKRRTSQKRWGDNDFMKNEHAEEKKISDENNTKV